MSSSNSKIFLLDEQGAILTPLPETAYLRETDLQQFLALYPDLLPGDRIATPARRWLFVSREMSVPDSAESGGRWSLDHLFLDQDGMPTFVECKRSSDTRGRREVVAQMLDYAANGVAHWKTGHIKNAFERRCEADGKVAADVLATFLAGGEPHEVEAPLLDTYWERVESNLRDRRIRLIFVADRIAPELKRLVEFLNEEMINVEVLAVEVRQYHQAGFSHRVLVPELVGATTLARIVKDTTRPAALDQEGFFEQLSSPAQEFHRRLSDKLDELQTVIEWTGFGFLIKLPVGASGKRVQVAYCTSPDKVQYYFDASVVDGETRRVLRDTLLQDSQGSFTAAGQHSANCWINAENAERALGAITAAIQRAREKLDSASG